MGNGEEGETTTAAVAECRPYREENEGSDDQGGENKSAALHLEDVKKVDLLLLALAGGLNAFGKYQRFCWTSKCRRRFSLSQR